MRGVGMLGWKEPEAHGRIGSSFAGNGDCRLRTRWWLKALKSSATWVGRFGDGHMDDFDADQMRWGNPPDVVGLPPGARWVYSARGFGGAGEMSSDIGTASLVQARIRLPTDGASAPGMSARGSPRASDHGTASAEPRTTSQFGLPDWRSRCAKTSSLREDADARRRPCRHQQW